MLVAGDRAFAGFVGSRAVGVALGLIVIVSSISLYAVAEADRGASRGLIVSNIIVVIIKD